MVEILPHLNAALNASSTVLLLSGWRFARAHHEQAHRACMVGAFSFSVLFLISYVTRYSIEGSHIYPGNGSDRILYLLVLATHVPLASIVPVLALRTIWLALQERTETHRRWARVTLPIWLYVSVTGVIVYGMLYHYAGVS